MILALLIGNITNDDGKDDARPTAPSSQQALTPVRVPAPPANPAADAACTSLLGKLPINLATTDGELSGRSAQSTWTYVAAWGEPAVVLRCGVPRPAGLGPGSAEQLFSANGAKGVYWLPERKNDVTVWTSVDRAVYVEVSVPTSYRQPPLGAIADAIGAALPVVCAVDPTVTDPAKLCTHRS